jgi:hypothetical protein
MNQRNFHNKCLGIDIGGANLKYCDGKGNGEIIYFPMWLKYPELKPKLQEIKNTFNPKITGIVITAELADSFSSKSEGIEYITGVAKEVFENILFLSVDGKLKREIDNPAKFSASNWVASVMFLLEKYQNFLFVDIGSTTSDFIPVTTRIEAGKTDFERLKRGELIYFGVLRTPVFYIMPKYRDIPVSSEYFAITGDVFILTNDIAEKDYNCNTPDGRGKKREDVLARLARVFCADLDEIEESFLEGFAFDVRREMIDTVKDQIKFHLNRYSLKNVIGCGIGEFLISEACNNINVNYISLREEFGRVSDLFPAFAIARLVSGKTEKWEVEP